MSRIPFDSLPQVVQELNAKIDNITSLLQFPKQNVQQTDLLVIKDAAKFLNLSVNTLYGKVSRREIPYMKQGNRLYFSKMELTDYIKSGKVLSDSEIQEQANNFLSKTNIKN
ncbi:helix-turn-helix domain-containing protein [Lutibacter maritimus]|uniref:DNA binding domain-containing protein, excisionase family n=1 Tax=Lutibacter maritimus TaxID=593133 RepID=A0A1I6RED0_9FLAO|nr:helix-turn-helix domain-containing protein [Lutibacter maritimus]SFS63016.1 DNA binding domain-containing protein, excisionase family [Lutibacter maritimus]